jgi:hypothetical protein
LHSPKDALTVLPPDVVAKIKESEMIDPYRPSKRWTCGHCTVHFGDLKSREIVVAHLKSVYVSSFYTYLFWSCPLFSLFISLFISHRIDSSREPEDLFLFKRNPSLVTSKGRRYIVDAPASTTCVKTILCMQCANGKQSERNRLFDIGGVKSHLSVK